ncbi:MAG: DUF2281 domain-containing protein [Sulfuricella sp.]|nr:DUF2281 domain-containing protein [Sulfuricella sp.]
MRFGELIAREAENLPADKQAEVLDFIAFLRQRTAASSDVANPAPTEDIEAFFRSFDVDVSDYKFDREEANAR